MKKVVIVGRPNVGKSSLFNRLVGRREAVVADEAGVTRDLKEAEVETDTGRFKLVDTGGVWSGDKWEKKIREKVDRAIEDADLVLFLVDGRAELTESDFEVADYLRKKGKPVVLVATKVDHPKHEDYLGELSALANPCPPRWSTAGGLKSSSRRSGKTSPSTKTKPRPRSSPYGLPSSVGRTRASPRF